MHKKAIHFIHKVLSRMILAPHLHGPESLSRYITTCQKSIYYQLPPFFSSIPFYFSVLVAWPKHNLFIVKTNSLACWIAYKRLSRASRLNSHSRLVLLHAKQHCKLIYQRIFQSPAGAQVADCITCLITQRILLRFLQTITFLPVCTCLSFYVCTCFIPNVSFIFNLSIPVCSHRLSRETH